MEHNKALMEQIYEKYKEKIDNMIVEELDGCQSLEEEMYTLAAIMHHVSIGVGTGSAVLTTESVLDLIDNMRGTIMDCHLIAKKHIESELSE
jgi:predicted TPR repeat methyltransferase